jgi:hypothetical protein
VSGGVGKDNLRRQLLRTPGVHVPHDFVSPPDYQLRTDSATAAPTTTSAYGGFQQARTSDTSPAQYNDPNRNWTTDSQGAGQLHFPLRDAARDLARTPRRVCRMTSATPEGNYHLWNRARRPAAGALTAPEGPTTSCSSSTSMCGHRVTNRLIVTLRVSLRAVPRLRLRVRPDRRQQHRPAELARDGLSLSPVHGELGG